MDRADTEFAQAGNGAAYQEYEVEKPTGGQRIQGTRRIVVRDEEGVPKYLMAVIDDITERKRAEHRIVYLAHHDGLTGQSDRSVAEGRRSSGARRHALGEPFSVLLLDLDRFKQVNDSMGHPTGDRLLTEVAARLKSLLRPDRRARPAWPRRIRDHSIRRRRSPPGGGDAGEPHHRQHRQPFAIDGVEIMIGTSIGIAVAAA